MSEISDLDEGSIVEYSLAEIGFVLVFVLLLLTGWEINSNAANLEKEAKGRAELHRQLEAEKKENQTLKAVASWLPPEATKFPDDFMFVDKQEYLALQARADEAQQVIEGIAPGLAEVGPSMLDAIIEMASSTEPPPDDPLIVSEAEQRELETALKMALEDVARMKAAIVEQPELPSPQGGMIGTIGYCTYEPPIPGSEKVFGSTVPLGTLLVAEDGVTLVAKNSVIQHGNFVDIAGENYDTTLAYEALSEWPIGKKLSATEFSDRGVKFIDIGNLPSDKRVACRFGMNYHRKIFSKKSADMLKDVVEGSFLRHLEISDATFRKQFPEYDVVLKENMDKQPVDSSAAPEEVKPDQENMSSATSSVNINIETLQTKNLVRTTARVLSSAQPTDPRGNRNKTTSGIVELSFLVAPSGEATEIKIVNEEPLGKGFAEACIAALKKYEFSPATENSIPVISERKTLVFKFK